MAAPVVDTTNSPHARLRPVPIEAVSLSDTFWEAHRQVVREVSIPEQYQRLEETGRLDNFRRVAGRKAVPYEGIFYNDSDVYKWLEAAAWSLATDPNPSLDALLDAVVEDIAGAQRTDGYLNTYFAVERSNQRWTNFDLHEMYCAGHLFQAAVAYYRATGKSRLLDVAARFADHICDTFGPEQEGRRLAIEGHPEIEMALVELYRTTGRKRYLEQARFFIDARGQGLLGKHRFGPEYHQDHAPFREMDRMVGHAVRAVYLNAGAADLHAETGEAALYSALERMWNNMVAKQMYISGGIGSRHEGEAFGKDFELPNERAYAETCAAIGSIMWAWRMLALQGDARFADVLETTLYNAALPGISLDGRVYFYENPLADDGTHRRQPWFGTACCPPNLARLLTSLPGYFYSTSEETAWVHLYASGAAHLTLPGGMEVKLSQDTRYPWDGRVEIEIRSAGTFGLQFRMPGWCEGAQVEVNGREYDTAGQPGTYAEIRRAWQAGDVVRLALPMPVRRVESHPYVSENTGRVALMRGPLLYCLEGQDHPGIDIRDIVVPAGSSLSTEFRPDLLGGVIVVQGQAEHVSLDSDWDGKLYRTARTEPAAGGEPTSLLAVPYYAWANREPARMQVWLRAR